MTLAVARIIGPRIAVASDTLIVKNGLRLPAHEGVIKSCLLPGGVCVSFANSPELAMRDCWAFYAANPNGADFGEVVTFFEASSKKTNNEYLLAFSKNPKIVKITDGRRQSAFSKTLWIGDKAAFEAFREVEITKKRYERGRAVNGALFADEMEGSPASDLYSTMRNLVLDPAVDSVGGFVCVVGNREDQFRHSVYSDMLYDWPSGETEDYRLDRQAKWSFGASGENEDYSMSQFSTSYGDFNCVGFYLLRAKIAYLFHPSRSMLADRCTVITNVGPKDLESRVREIIRTDLGWLIFIAGPSSHRRSTVLRPSNPGDKGGSELGIFMHANTYSAKEPRVLLPLMWKAGHTN